MVEASKRYLRFNVPISCLVSKTLRARTLSCSSNFMEYLLVLSPQLGMVFPDHCELLSCVSGCVCNLPLHDCVMRFRIGLYCKTNFPSQRQGYMFTSAIFAKYVLSSKYDCKRQNFIYCNILYILKFVYPYIANPNAKLCQMFARYPKKLLNSMLNWSKSYRAIWWCKIFLFSIFEDHSAHDIYIIQQYNWLFSEAFYYFAVDFIKPWAFMVFQISYQPFYLHRCDVLN